MVKILIDRSVVVQALEALTCTGEHDDPGHRCTHCDDYVDRNGPARAALRAALEQPNHSEQHLNTAPAGWKLVPVEPTDDMLYDIQEYSHILPPRGKRIWAHMLTAAPQPPTVKDSLTIRPQVEHEPVAWMIWTHGPVLVFMNKDEANLEFDRLNHTYPAPTRMLVPLYISPQAQRKPLTDEQITELADAHMEAFAQFVGAGEVWFEGEKEFARAIERAHGIGGEK